MLYCLKYISLYVQLGLLRPFITAMVAKKITDIIAD